MHDEAQPRALILAIEDVDFCRSGGPAFAVEQHALRERAHRLIGDRPLHDGNVLLFHAIAWVEDPLGEVAVVGEKQGARSVPVETPHGEDAGARRDKLEHGRTSLGVARGRHDPLGFVEQVVGVTLGQARGAPIHQYLVPARLDEGG